MFIFVLTNFMNESQGEDNNTSSSSTTNNSATSTSATSGATTDEEESEAEVENGNRALKSRDDHAAAEGEGGGAEAS